MFLNEVLIAKQCLLRGWCKMYPGLGYCSVIG
ncbi:hypothetical protein T12_1566 [Trichinella patagoniensis]|uniref:Uncharacterized protein n=1 Tax=Trichinella patagoniensis TaxID=990121 RepID=A0A0V0XRN2_9BILA|nr:hypothetical protein T09_6697 [Trichinella sp. T9]KRX90457.1 hypothetical protein T12_1566 [Trichinella patagoniensis]